MATIVRIRSVSAFVSSTAEGERALLDLESGSEVEGVGFVVQSGGFCPGPRRLARLFLLPAICAEVTPALPEIEMVHLRPKDAMVRSLPIDTCARRVAIFTSCLFGPYFVLESE